VSSRAESDDVAPQWRTVAVEVTPELADGVANLLFELGASGVLTDEGGGRARLEGAFPADESARVTTAVERYLESLGARGAVTTATVAPVDWTAVYRAHHRPLPVGRRFLIAPPWDVPPAPEREILVIDPGMAFGTGQHETTRGCLEALETAVASVRIASALDVGTGSGILALALARLGVARVVGVDVDPAVLPLARANLVANRAPHVALAAGTVAAVRGRFDLVVANLLAGTVIAEAALLARAVASGGRLVLSGILEHQASAVRDAYPEWRVEAVRAEAEWRTLTLARGA
jgi:ribosomal protein L11 methyltransferase